MMNEIKVKKTYFQLSTSTVVDKWTKKVIKLELKSLKFPLKMNKQQRLIIDDWINTSNYIYNKTLEKIKNGRVINFNSLRDLLVTENTKKHSYEYKKFDILSNKLKLKKKNILGGGESYSRLFLLINSTRKKY